MAITLIMLVALVPPQAGANHDPADDYETVNLGGDRIWYIDDSFPPMIYREDNQVGDFQRGADGSGHLSHTNPDERIF